MIIAYDEIIYYPINLWIDFNLLLLLLLSIIIFIINI